MSLASGQYKVPEVNSFNFNSKLVEQAQDVRIAEFGTLYGIFIRIDAVVSGSAEVCTAQLRGLKHGALQVTTIKNCLGQIGFGKIGLGDRAVDKFCLFELFLVEIGKIEVAAIETQIEEKVVAGRKIQSDQLAILEKHALQARTFQLGIAKIAAREAAIDEIDLAQVCFCKIAVQEFAAFVFREGQAAAGIVVASKSAVADVFLLHRQSIGSVSSTCQ